MTRPSARACAIHPSLEDGGDGLGGHIDPVDPAKPLGGHVHRRHQRCCRLVKDEIGELRPQLLAPILAELHALWKMLGKREIEMFLAEFA